MKVLAVLLILCPLSLLAQGHKPTSHVHSTVPTDIIDGAKTPNLIPDVAAWRLWLLAVTTEDKTKPELKIDRLHSFLRVAGVGDDEMPLAEEALAHFRMDYQTLVDHYNKRMSDGEQPSLAEFRAQRDALVQATQTSLLGVVAPRSAIYLKSFVKGEKSRMKVAREVQ
jgi:hypothetical protein